MTNAQLDAFEANRTHLLGIAYRMLGEMSSAEDVVQETWLRWQRSRREDIRDPRAWLSAAAVRLALDALRKARARRETYIGPWLPGPILPDDMRAFAADAPAARAELASDLSLALLNVLERLSPEERAALILHDAFDCDYGTIAQILERSEQACRKLVSRARERVKADRPRHTATTGQHRALVEKFILAAASNDSRQLSSLLASDVVLYSDGGGRAAAALNPIYGADKVIRFGLGVMKKFAPAEGFALEITDINGAPGYLLRTKEGVHTALTMEFDGDLISAIYLVRNPDKLGRVSRPSSAVSLPSA
jgi:RNA polymerase sigma-70 factor (ECF subfamily)